MLDTSRNDLIAGVVGSGTMGRGIVQVLAQGAMQVKVFDTKAGAAQAARDSIAQALAKQVEKNRLTSAQADAIVARIEPVNSLKDLAPCHMVVEAVFERLDIKHELFKALEEIV